MPRKRSESPAKGPAAPTGRPADTIYRLDALIVEGLMEEEFVEQNPVVRRTIEIRGNQTLEDLHGALFHAFDRFEEHMYEFQFGRKPDDRGGPTYTGPYIEGESDGDPRRAQIAALGLSEGQVFWYRFDFGDNWQHEITVVDIGSREPDAKYPRVVDKVGDSPPQYPEYDDGDDEEEDWDE